MCVQERIFQILSLCLICLFCIFCVEIYASTQADLVKCEKNQIPINGTLTQICGKLMYEAIPEDVNFETLQDGMVLFKKFLVLTPDVMFQTDKIIMSSFKTYCITNDLLSQYKSFIQIVNKYNNKTFS